MLSIFGGPGIGEKRLLLSPNSSGKEWNKLDRPNWNHSPVWFDLEYVYYMFGYPAHFQSCITTCAATAPNQPNPGPKKNTQKMLPAKKVLPSFGAYLGGPVFEQNSSEDKLGKAWSSPRDILKTTCFCCWQQKQHTFPSMARVVWLHFGGKMPQSQLKKL